MGGPQKEKAWDMGHGHNNFFRVSTGPRQSRQSAYACWMNEQMNEWTNEWANKWMNPCGEVVLWKWEIVIHVSHRAVDDRKQDLFIFVFLILDPLPGT